MNNNLQKIKEACIKANDDIMKLQFGCVVMTEGVLTPESITGTLETEAGIVTRVDTFVYRDAPVSIIIKILGRPIRLSDVLLALGKQQKVNPELELFSIQLGIGEALWDLSDDNLEHQSEETLSFIAELL